MIAKKTPANPSRRAIARVKNPLPIPTICPNCGGPVQVVNNSAIYGRPFGEWPWAVLCDDKACDSYVGFHPFTNIPLGTLANKATREARKRAKNLFNRMWGPGKLSRDDAYAWLAGQLEIADVQQCHIGWFDAAMCERVYLVCKKTLEVMA